MNFGARVILTGATLLYFSACTLFTKPDVSEGLRPELCQNHDLIPSMGTTFELYSAANCLTDDDNRIALGVKKILDQYENSLSLYQSESDISRLNREGFLNSPSPTFLEALRLGLQHARETNGAFDPTIRRGYRLIENQIKESGVPPTESQLRKLIPLTDYHKIEWTDQRVQFQKPGMEITLDGNVKGLAVDRVADYLKQSGIHHFVANFSGNMRVEGHQLNGKPWNISVEHPLTKEPVQIPFPFQAISTSAPTYNHFTSDRSWHHLLDPKTLKPANRFVSTTVFGPSAETCDALSTAVFMMEPKTAQKVFRANFSGYHYWLFLPDGSKVQGP